MLLLVPLTDHSHCLFQDRSRNGFVIVPQTFQYCPPTSCSHPRENIPAALHRANSELRVFCPERKPANMHVETSTCRVSAMGIICPSNMDGPTSRGIQCLSLSLSLPLPLCLLVSLSLCLLFLFFLLFLLSPPNTVCTPLFRYTQ